MVKTSRVQQKAAAAVILAGLLCWFGFKRYQKSQGATAQTGTATAQRGDIEMHFTDSGELAPKDGVDIASKVSGRVLELFVDEGSRVKKGDRLATIQPGRTEAEKYVPATLVSPIGGVVMRYQKPGNYQEESRIAKLGDYITGLMESTAPSYLMTVADLSRLVVKMKISEMDILKLREGMPVTVTVDALPGAKFDAKVSLVSPQADKDSNNLKNFKVEVALLRSDPKLKPGMTARVDGLLDSRLKVVKIPLSTVFEENGGEFAYLHDPDAKPKKVALKLGLRNETEVEVTEGVSEGQKLYTEKPEDKPKS